AGWVPWGGVALVGAEGFVDIQGRIKDRITSGGETVYPAEIENVLSALPGLEEVAVIGLPSPKWGESPLAVVVKSDENLTDSDVLDFCKGKLAPFKLPKSVEFIDVIPRNPTGKVLKRLLREQFPGPAPT
ncbi:MAG: 2-succinylbenzoyl-CoA synthetase, partial [Proteobacteria bacterium]|nr:2-succinylbenzoyl-CoA synthetase [Pseudomonadota bacterium]